MSDTHMEENTDYYQIDNVEENEEFPARYVTIMSLMRTVDATEEAMDVDQSLIEELQGSNDEEDCEQESIERQTYKAPTRINKTKKTCRKYTREQVVEFCGLTQEGWPIKAAANKTGIILQTAYRYAQYYSEHQEVPDIWKPRGPPKAQILGNVHEFFIRELIDHHGTYTLEYMRETLMQKFPEIVISRTAFYHFIKDKCALSIKKVQQISEYRNSDETKQKRREAVLGWLADKDMDFENNCAF